MLFQAKIRVVETVVLENGVLSSAENRWFWRKLGYCVLPTKTKEFAPQAPDIDENDENGRCHPDKVTFCQKHCFDNPEKSTFSGTHQSLFWRSSATICAIMLFLKNELKKPSNKRPRRNQKDWRSKVHPSNMNPPKTLPRHKGRHRDCDATHTNSKKPNPNNHNKQRWWQLQEQQRPQQQ